MNHMNLRIGVVHITAGESSKILCRWPAKALLNQWIEKGGLDGIWYNTLSIIVKKAVPFDSLHQEFRLRRYGGKLSTHGKNNLFMFWNVLSKSHIGIHVRRRR